MGPITYHVTMRGIIMCIPRIPNPEPKVSYSIDDADKYALRVSSVVVVDKSFTLKTETGPINIPIEVRCDFSEIPAQYHKMICDIMLRRKVI